MAKSNYSRWHGTIEGSGGELAFAVWFQGYIVKFVATREEAERLLRKLQGGS